MDCHHYVPLTREVFEEAVNNTDDLNIVTDTFTPGTKEHIPRMIMRILTPAALAPYSLLINPLSTRLFTLRVMAAFCRLGVGDFTIQ